MDRLIGIDELDFLFGPAKEYRDESWLKDFFNLERYQISIPETINIDTLRKIKRDSIVLENIYPTAIIPIWETSGLEASIINKLQLKYHRISYRESSSKEIQFKTFYIYPLVVLIQCIMSNNLEFKHLKFKCGNFKQGLDIIRLNIEISEDSNQGRRFDKINSGEQAEMIDSMDIIYDEYKHTLIPVSKFRLIYRCFGNRISDVGSSAFDNFMESRDYLQAWKKAIHEFLVNDRLVSEQFAHEISEMILT